MTINSNNALLRVREIIAEKFLISDYEIKPESKFVDDLGGDSLDIVELIVAIEEEFNIEISDEILNKIVTVEDVMNIYMESWQYGLKGVTIYVDGSRDAILTTDNTPKPKIIDNNYIPRPKIIDADFYQVKVKEELFSVIVGLYENKPYEVWAFKAEKNIEIAAGRDVNMETTTSYAKNSEGSRRNISLLWLRSNFCKDYI